MDMSIINFFTTCMITIDPYSFILAGLTAIASGIVGSFALMRRMTLAGDALSHVALPGIGLALLYSYNPAFGGAVTLLVGAVLIWKVEKLSQLNVEAIIGVLFAISLAIGALVIKGEHELVETLFGGITPVTTYEFIFGSLIALGIIFFIIHSRHALVLMLVSKELAKTINIATEKLQLVFLLMFALTVILGMKFFGVLLMGSLIIIPAATARNIAKNLNSMLALSSIVALVSVASGMIASQFFTVQLGPVIILIAGMLFVGTLIFNFAVSKHYA